ncbi:unnamed protein product [Dibothriocephalus latus]|uniref:Uncharacterized protein n=1 Tax=Dibothriocephalus latus TaxID=60516 RepID=A0A3P6QTZ2_DIBLA|nr:unnamed protein product [Dibothriocephalus latus]
MQLQYDAQKFREEARMAQCQLDLTKQALEEAKAENAELKRSLEALRGDIDIYEGLKERSAAAVAGLQSSHREALRNVAHLEAQIRDMKDKLNESPQEESEIVEKMKRNAADLTTRLGLPERAKTDLDFLFSEVILDV